MTSVLFPIFIWLAERTERHRTPILILFATLQGFAAVLFFTWRELTEASRSLAAPESA